MRENALSVSLCHILLEQNLEDYRNILAGKVQI